MLNDEQVALLIDPERARAGWWGKLIPNACPHCGRPLHGTCVTPPAEDLIGGYRCMSCRVMHTAEFNYTGPRLTTDRVAAFTYVTPVLLAAGLMVEEYPWGAYVRINTSENDPEIPFASWECISGNEDEEGCPIPYPAATTAALAWLAEHEPERLREALEEVGRG